MIIILLLTFVTILFPFIVYYFNKTTKVFKNTLIVNLTSFAFVLTYSIIFITTNVYANTEITSEERGMAFLAAALVTGMCTIGTGIATGQAASAALGAISENEGLMGKALIFVALAEGIAIYGLLISFTILGRV
ncbi:MAG: ATP synthase subunit C [Defluviitaleaceae bacterium]|nr:ATP synthase subunit C [Defluviitaleaceae bacterium]